MGFTKFFRLTIVGLFILSSLGMVMVSNATTPSSIFRKDNSSITTAESLNWSGYAVTGSSGSVTSVAGSWTVPAVQSCTSTNTYSSFWVGIDGFSSNSVEQLGTDSDCSNGVPTYYAWREMYPQPGFYINSITITPGDVITASVTFSNPTTYTLSMKDVTTGQSFSFTAHAQADRSSAEWIVEAPYSGGILPLANFGKAYFTNNYATVNGQTAYINQFPSSSTYRINMVTSNLVLKDSTSMATHNGDFSVTWLSQGP